MNTIDGYVIETTGKCHPTTIPTGNLEAIDNTIGCRNVDAVDLPGGLTVYVDDEGAINGSPFNLALTIVIHILGGTTPIFGNGLFLGFRASDGADVSLTSEQKARILAAIDSTPDENTVAALARTLAPIRHTLGIHVSA